MATINYESATFWATVAALVVAVIVSTASLYFARVSVRISQGSLNLTKEMAERELRNWTQRLWFDLYQAAENFITLLERFQAKYDKPLATREFENDTHDLTFAARQAVRLASVFPQNPSVDAFFACINKWDLRENLFSKEMLQDYADAIEGFRQEARVPEAVISSPQSIPGKHP